MTFLTIVLACWRLLRYDTVGGVAAWRAVREGRFEVRSGEADALEQLVALLRDEAHPALRPVAAPAPVAPVSASFDATFTSLE